MGKLLKRSMIDEIDKWDIAKMFENEEQFNQCLTEIKQDVNKVLAFKGKIMLNSDSLYNFYQEYEHFNRKLEKVWVYAKMLFDSETNNNEFAVRKMRVEKLFEQINDKLSFITPEILSVNKQKVMDFINENPALEPYRFDLEMLFKYQNHTLSEAEELIITKALNAMGTGSQAFNSLNNTDIDLGIITLDDGEKVQLTNSNYSVYMSSKDRKVRMAAFNNMYHYWKQHINTVASTLKGTIKEHFFISDVHKFESPLKESLYGDDIDVKVYQNLIKTVHDNFDKIYDYMAIRKKMLNLDELHMYDIYVDLVNEKEIKVPFEEGKKIVFEALKPLGEKYLKDLEQAFNNRWIDIYPNIGKRSGAYSWGCYDSYPYLLLNYENDIDSVSTMIHELGHSMHSYYSNKTQSYTYHSYPIFLAEIASTVNEALLNQYLYDHAQTKEEKINYLTQFLDLFRTTIHRQTMFAEFEMIMYNKEEQGVALTEQEFCDTYYNLNKLYFGDNVVSDDLIRYEWARIPHFYTPFYVYKYATGLSAALAIVSEILNGNTSVRDKYLEFLASGGSDYPLNILKKVGVDMTTSKPIQKAFDMFEEKLNLLKKLSEQ